MVEVAAKIAAALEMRAINIFPLQGSLYFWRKMGYKPKPYTTRVFYREIFVGRDLVVRASEYNGRCSIATDPRRLTKADRTVV